MTRQIVNVNGTSFEVITRDSGQITYTRLSDAAAKRALRRESQTWTHVSR